MSQTKTSPTNPIAFQISTTITIDRIGLVGKELIFAVCNETFTGKIKQPGPVLLTKLKWDHHNIKMKFFMELLEDSQNFEYRFKFLTALSGIPKEVESDGSDEIFYVSSFKFDMKFGDKWEGDDAQDITLGKSAQDLTEVEFGFTDILNTAEVTITADLIRQKKL